MVEIKLLNFRYRFRPLTWREEFALERQRGKRDWRRLVLAASMVEIEEVDSSRKRQVSREEAEKLVNSLPSSVLNDTFLLFKDALPKDRRFNAAVLYQAPEPSKYSALVAEQEDETETEHDQVMERAYQTFGRQEVSEQQEIERQIVAGARRDESGFRGAVRVEEDHE